MSGRKILEQTPAYHRQQHSLCARLEAVADGLPRKIDQQECLMLARDIYPTIKEAHDFEESELFPHLQRHACTEALVEGFERQRFEHWEDEAYAEEISDVLAQMGRSGSAADAETISWMLRGLVDGSRRHIAFEAEHLVPILKSLIEPDAKRA